MKNESMIRKPLLVGESRWVCICVTSRLQGRSCLYANTQVRIIIEKNVTGCGIKVGVYMRYK